MENICCRLCGSCNYRQYLARRDLTLSVAGVFQLVRCEECGLVYLNPSPSESELVSYYTEDYDQYTVAVEDESSIITRLARWYGLRKRARVITRYKRKGRLLDIGCATGDFLAEMRDYSHWEVSGVEMNATAVEYARRRLGLSVYEGSLEEAHFPDASFDAVTLWNVLEHFYDPVATMREIHRVTKPSGILVITTPLLDTLGARFFGKYWIGYELPRHLSIFSSATLLALFDMCGFSKLDQSCVYGGYAAMASSVRFWLRGECKVSTPIRRILEAALFSFPARLLFSPALFVVSRCFQTCSIPTVIARKE